MENSYNNLLEEAYSCLASKNYKKAINIFERILETDKNSYEALFGLILVQNKCSSKELFLNNIELVSSNIDSLDKVIELCDKDIAIKEIIHPISLALFKNINEINEESCIIILDFLVKYNYDNTNFEREKLIDYAIMNSNIIIFNKVIKLLDNESQVLYKVKMQKSLLQKKHFEEAKALALETLNVDKNNDDSLYTLFCTYIGDRNIIEALDCEAYKLIDKVIACEKIPNKCVRKLYNEIINLDYIEGKTNALDKIIKRIKNENELKSNLSFKIAKNLKEEKHYDEAIKFYNYFIESTDTNQELGYEGLLLCKYKCEDVKKLAKSKTSFAKSNEYERLLTSVNQNNNKELYRKYYDCEKIWVRNINLKRKIRTAICLLIFLVVGIMSLILYVNIGGEIKVITEPTETEEGVIGRYVFGKKKEEITIEPLSDEKYKEKITKEPTCEGNGTKTYTYKKYKNKLSFTIEIPAKGHDYSSWKLGLLPTLEKEGSAYRECLNDKLHKEETSMPILDDKHYQYKIIKQKTCTEDGLRKCIYKIDDDTLEFESIIAKGYEYERWDFDIIPTLEEEGKMSRVCKNDRTHIETIIIPKLNTTDYNIKTVYEPTCEEKGLILCEYDKNGTGYIFEGTTPAKGHEYDQWNVVEKPTTKEEGIISRVCKNDSKHIETKKLPLLDDVNYTQEVQKEATCTETGEVIYTYIINDERIVFEDIIPTKEHDYIKYACSKCGKQREYYIEDGYLYFGSYPQIIKDASVNIISNEKDENGYFTGSDGEKYALLKAGILEYEEYGTTFSDGEKIEKNKEYYFKVEPIKWKILEDKGGKVFVFSELILDAHRFDDSSNDYSISSIRSWLNDEFYNITFTDKQKVIIESSTLDDVSNVTDKVFLLSIEEITKESYGFLNNYYEIDEERCKEMTDYAKIKVSKEKLYWLRTPSSYHGYAVYGRVYFCSVDNENCGVAPALVLNK